MRQAGAFSTIELSVDDIAQIYESLDPYPFHERDLDRDAEDYIVGWARELPHDHDFRILVRMPAAALSTPGARDLGRSMNRFFALRARSSAGTCASCSASAACRS